MAQTTKRKSDSISRFKSRRTIMRISLAISLLFHVGLLLVIQKAFPINWMTKPLRTFHVELFRPPVDPLDENKTAGMNLSGIKPEKMKQAEETEDTISLDTKDKKYISYAKVIKESLVNNWEYPGKARQNLIEGQVLVIFRLNRQGQLKDIRILKSSTFDILDGETTRAIRTAAPFPPFPGSVTVKKLNIKANFTYRLTAHK